MHVLQGEWYLTQRHSYFKCELGIEQKSASSLQDLKSSSGSQKQGLQFCLIYKAYATVL